MHLWRIPFLGFVPSRALTPSACRRSYVRQPTNYFSRASTWETWKPQHATAQRFPQNLKVQQKDELYNYLCVKSWKGLKVAFLKSLQWKYRRGNQEQKEKQSNKSILFRLQTSWQMEMGQTLCLASFLTRQNTRNIRQTELSAAVGISGEKPCLLHQGCFDLSASCVMTD